MWSAGDFFSLQDSSLMTNRMKLKKGKYRGADILLFIYFLKIFFFLLFFNTSKRGGGSQGKRVVFLFF